MMSQIAVIAVKVVTEAPEFGQGDTEAKPKPDPRASKISDNAAVAKAPPMIAAQEIAEIDDSKVWPASLTPRVSAARPLKGTPAILAVPSISARTERVG
jgi:hypothetical protein